MNIMNKIDEYLNEAKTLTFQFSDELERNGFIGDMEEWGQKIKQQSKKGKLYFAEVDITKVKDKNDLQAIADFADDHEGKKV